MKARSLICPAFRDSPASLSRLNPTLNTDPDATSSFLKRGPFAADGQFLAIRAMSNDEQGRMWQIP